MCRICAVIGALVLLLTACGSAEGGSRDGDAARVVDGAVDTDDDADAASDDITERPLDPFEQAFVDGAMAEGATERAARCVLGELIARDLDLLELASAREELQPELLDAVFACGDELLDSDTSVFGTGDRYGDDPELDALWDACATGDMDACDDLFLQSPVGSEYERFGATCGDKSTTTGLCGGGFTGGDPVDGPFTYGDDPQLDGLWDACAAGDADACDELFWTSPVDSEYEEFGRTCGDTNPSAFGCTDDRAA